MARVLFDNSDTNAPVAHTTPTRREFGGCALAILYSRVRTEEFTVVAADRPPVRFSTIFCPRSRTTGEVWRISCTVLTEATLAYAAVGAL